MSVMAMAILSACGGAKPEPLTPEVELANAAREARETFPIFLEHLKAQPSDTSAWLTIQMPPEGAERPQAELSLKNIVQTDTSFSGVIWKPDRNWPEFPAGATMSFPASIVIDWVYVADKRTVGGYRLRAKMCLASRAAAEKIPEKVAQHLRAEAEEAAAFLLDPKKACAPYDAEKDLEAKAK
ncbi:MAG: DUF2314 domain-containing protein [Hyphomonadaceae bacterium]|nr:DUF2314 domain-containing protein [Hyphomonadaceae bacterium]